MLVCVSLREVSYQDFLRANGYSSAPPTGRTRASLDAANPRQRKHYGSTSHEMKSPGDDDDGQSVGSPRDGEADGKEWLRARARVVITHLCEVSLETVGPVKLQLSRALCLPVKELGASVSS